MYLGEQSQYIGEQGLLSLSISSSAQSQYLLKKHVPSLSILTSAQSQYLGECPVSVSW